MTQRELYGPWYDPKRAVWLMVWFKENCMAQRKLYGLLFDLLFDLLYGLLYGLRYDRKRAV